MHALFAALVLGLLAMFLLGLPADMKARAERRRLARRVEELEARQRAVTPEPVEPRRFED